MVPKGWQKTKIKDIAETVTSGARDWARFYSDSGSKFIRMTNLSRGDIHLKLGTLKYVSISDESVEANRTSLRPGDILISITAELGKIGLVPKGLGRAYINQHTALIRLNEEKADSQFVAYMLSTPWMNKRINRLNDAGAKAALNLPSVNAIDVLLPPLSEQKKIAKILSTWDEAIASTEQLLTSSERQKKALMHQLLTGKNRLPGFEGEWPFVTMGQIFRRVTTRNEGQSTNVVTMSGQQGLIRQQEFFKKSVASETLDGYFLLEKGQFAYNKSYSNGYPMGAIKRLNRYEKAVVTTLYICFEIENEEVADSDYFEHFFEAGLLNHGLSKVANEGGRAHGLLNVKPSDFFSLRVPLPKLNEQKTIARVITAAEEDIQRFKQDLELLKEEKRALMQQLLAGKRRVKVGEAELATA